MVVQQAKLSCKDLEVRLSARVGNRKRSAAEIAADFILIAAYVNLSLGRVCLLLLRWCG